MTKNYTYWTLELYDQPNGIRGGGGLGILAADTRRVAEQMQLPFTLVTPFYPVESHQHCKNGTPHTTLNKVDYRKFDFTKIGTATIRTKHLDGGPAEHEPQDTQTHTLDIVQKKFGSSQILCMTAPDFGELYSGETNSDHRLFQQVSLGFGGYQALKCAQITHDIFQLNESAALFAAVAHLDRLVTDGAPFDQALKQLRAQTLYTNHTLVHAAEAQFTRHQFERFVFPNLQNTIVRKWLETMMENHRIYISTIALAVSGARSGVSKLHAKVAEYYDADGERVHFDAVTNGIDLAYWTLPAILDFYQKQGIVDQKLLPAANYQKHLDKITSNDIKTLKSQGRDLLNKTLKNYPDHNGKILEFAPDDLIFTFKRRFVAYKRPDLPFRDPERLAHILEQNNAHYILTGRIHENDQEMHGKFDRLMEVIDAQPVLKERVHYLPDYDEKLATGLAAGGNVTINTPIIGLEACGTSWEKDIANLNLIISTHDGGVADKAPTDYLNVAGDNEAAEAEALYQRMEQAAAAWRDEPTALATLLQTELSAYLPVISGTRMMQDYLAFFDKSML